ncbi:Isocitrate lyase [Durusdinium trenchii]|uniref:Isocitrate lyase n=1 Tax=Durusdinium trenchii TaxID=1381693 RepID=A0ABP0PNN1_9DINO
MVLIVFFGLLGPEPAPILLVITNVNVGAQGAVRHVDAIARLRAERLNELDLVTLVRALIRCMVACWRSLNAGFCGSAPLEVEEKLALTVTEIPYEVLQIFQMPYVAGSAGWLTRLHAALLHTVPPGWRAAGYRSVSMPTLCTGGIGIPVQFVAVAAVRSVYWDFCAHPTDPMRVRLCCFELGHLRMARAAGTEGKQEKCEIFGDAVKMEVLDHFYRPEVAEAGRLCGRSDGVGEGEVTPEDLPLSDEDPEDMLGLEPGALPSGGKWDLREAGQRGGQTGRKGLDGGSAGMMTGDVSGNVDHWDGLAGRDSLGRPISRRARGGEAARAAEGAQLDRLVLKLEVLKQEIL